jgi:hypothetical protein
MEISSGKLKGDGGASWAVLLILVMIFISKSGIMISRD